jgi:hypothetical protein
MDEISKWGVGNTNRKFEVPTESNDFWFKIARACVTTAVVRSTRLRLGSWRHWVGLPGSSRGGKP